MFNSVYAVISLTLLLLASFPGGTIAMAIACRGTRLNGWDWVLSVILPAYGLTKALLAWRSRKWPGAGPAASID